MNLQIGIEQGPNLHTPPFFRGEFERNELASFFCIFIKSHGKHIL